MMRRVHPTFVVALSALFSTACGGDSAPSDGLTGAVEIDGSSTVFPVMEAIAEEFQIENPRARVTIGVSGTGGGFGRFCEGETDISNASRPITDREREECAAAGVEFTEFPIAWDGLSVIVSPENDWVDCLTVEEVRSIWQPESTVTTWSDIRAGFPDEEITLYGPGTASGTFDYFTEALMGESGASRPDYQASEDDNVLVWGVVGDPHALAYFGYAYYIENEDRLKALEIDAGTGCVGPMRETIEQGTYAPLSRPLFIYVRHESAARPVVAEFLRFAFTQGPELVPASGYIALTPEQYQAQLAIVDSITSAGD